MTARVVICCGSGGVGKTTVSAALAIKLATEGHRVAVLTIDPARRLADSLGVGTLGNEARRVPLTDALGPVSGSLDAIMLDAKATFDERPCLANREKRQFQELVNVFVDGVKPASYTDITGGVLQAAEYLEEKATGRKVILIFSDLAEDLKDGYVRDIPLSLDGFEVVALNVTKLRSDNIDPRDYMQRLEDWKVRVEASGGQWRVINDLDRLDPAFLG